MKKLIVLLIITLSSSLYTFGQKFAYVNTELILESMPEYTEAQEELDKKSKKWQEEIEAMYAEIDRLYQSYQAEKILLTEDLKRKREKEIEEREKELQKFQKDKFGVNGELFKTRQKLIQPLQDKIYKALQDVATRNNYAVILDLAGNSNVLYSQSRYDKTDLVIKKLGYSK